MFHPGDELDLSIPWIGSLLIMITDRIDGKILLLLKVLWWPDLRRVSVRVPFYQSENCIPAYIFNNSRSIYLCSETHSL